MRIAFYGSSLLSSYWNGAATYYRGLLSDLGRRGHAITFYEPDAFDRQKHRDIDPPPYAEVQGLPRDGRSGPRRDRRGGAGGRGGQGLGRRRLRRRAARGRRRRLAARGDPHLLGRGRPRHPRRAARERRPRAPPRAPRPRPRPHLRRRAAGGRGLRRLRRPPLRADLQRPRPRDPPSRAGRGSLSRRPVLSRQPPSRPRGPGRAVLPGARRPASGRSFLLGGNGWETKAMPPNVRHLGHVGTREHNGFNASPLAVLNIARDSMAATGFSPATRVFEAAGAGACLLTDAWVGLELFLAEGTEVLVARDGRDVADLVESADARAREGDRRGGAGTHPGRAHLRPPRRAGGRDPARDGGAEAREAGGMRNAPDAPLAPRRPRLEPVLVLGQRPRDHLPRAAQGLRGARPRHPLPGARRPLVPRPPRPRPPRLLPPRPLPKPRRAGEASPRGRRGGRGDRRLLRPGRRRRRALGAAHRRGASSPSTTSTPPSPSPSWSAATTSTSPRT